MALQARRLPRPCLCQDLCLGGERRAGPRIPWASLTGRGGAGGARLGSPESPQMSVLEAASGQSGSCFPPRRLLRRQALQLSVLPSRSLPPPPPHNARGRPRESQWTMAAEISRGARSKEWPFTATGQRYWDCSPAPQRPLGLPAKGTGQNQEPGLASPCFLAFLGCLRRPAAGPSGSEAQQVPALKAGQR